MEWIPIKRKNYVPRLVNRHEYTYTHYTHTYTHTHTHTYTNAHKYFYWQIYRYVVYLLRKYSGGPGMKYRIAWNSTDELILFFE